MKHHVYRFGQKIYRQQEGGAIGSRLTGSVARIVMDEWIDEFLQRMEERGYTLHMWKKYVDDINFLIEDPEPDEAWCEDRCRKPGREPKVVYSAPRPAGSRGWGCPACHMRRDSEVLALVMNVANGIHKWVQFTGVSVGESETGEIPMLDFQLRVEHLSEGETVRF